jgi:alkylhydroperoxidase family enzyme
VLADYRTAPIGEGLRATLAFLARVTLEPAEIGPADAEAPRRAGVSDEALADALYVCAFFNLIDRLADAFAFTPISQHLGREGLLRHEERFLARGYV